MSKLKSLRNWSVLRVQTSDWILGWGHSLAVWKDEALRTLRTEMGPAQCSRMAPAFLQGHNLYRGATSSDIFSRIVHENSSKTPKRKIHMGCLLLLSSLCQDKGPSVFAPANVLVGCISRASRGSWSVTDVGSRELSLVRVYWARCLRL